MLQGMCVPSSVSTPETRPPEPRIRAISRVGVELDRPRSQSALYDPGLGHGQHIGPVAVVGHEVVDADLLGAQSLCDLDGRRPAADDHCGLALTASRYHIPRIPHVVEFDDTIEVGAGYVQRYGRCPCAISSRS